MGRLGIHGFCKFKVDGKLSYLPRDGKPVAPEVCAWGQRLQTCKSHRQSVTDTSLRRARITAGPDGPPLGRRSCGGSGRGTSPDLPPLSGHRGGCRRVCPSAGASFVRREDVAGVKPDTTGGGCRRLRPPFRYRDCSFTLSTVFRLAFPQVRPLCNVPCHGEAPAKAAPMACLVAPW